MIGQISDKNGWIYVSAQRPADWKFPTFFALVDATFEKIQTAYEQKARKVVFDVSTLEYIDSTMISLFLQAARMTEPQRDAIIVANEYTRDLLSLLGIDKLFDIFNSQKEWLEAQQ
jgi:anti-anti-sigma factor